VERGVIGIEHVTRPPVVGVPAGSAAEKAGLKTFDRILAVNGTGTPDEGALYQQLAKAEGTLTVTVMRAKPVPAGAVTARVSDVVDVKVEKQPGEGLAALGVESADLYVGSVLPGSAADKAGLKAGDRLLAFNGEPLRSFPFLFVKLNGLKDQSFQLAWRGADGQERSGTLAQAPIESKDEHGQVTARLELGARQWASADMPPIDKVTVNLDAWGALKEATLVVPKIIGQMVTVLAKLVTFQLSPKMIGGPIMMYQMAAKTQELGLDYFLNLMAVISINLGVMNLLPIPVLDGFHLLSAAWEGIRRRPIPVRVREVANMVGLAVLILLMLLAVTNDITR
jgi:regulator of sigma E protease